MNETRGGQMHFDFVGLQLIAACTAKSIKKPKKQAFQAVLVF